VKGSSCGKCANERRAQDQEVADCQNYRLSKRRLFMYIQYCRTTINIE